MKKLKRLFLLGIFVGSLAACAQNEAKEVIMQGENSQEEIIMENQEVSLENYVEDFPDYEFTEELDDTVDDRHFEAEEAPENIVEELVFHDYSYDIKGEFDKLLEIYGEEEALKISARNTKKSFDEGAYMKEYVIHDLSTWSKEDFQNSDYDFMHILKSDILKNQFTSFAIVQVDISMEWSKAALDRGPQLGNGEYTRLFLCGKNSDDDSWKIYEIYWVDE
ncbi:MAG: hypothetical protein PHU31_11120 [Anaerotignum sp.]|nr:hypothetical protein [Anaerotignum sp.]